MPPPNARMIKIKKIINNIKYQNDDHENINRNKQNTTNTQNTKTGRKIEKNISPLSERDSPQPMHNINVDNPQNKPIAENNNIISQELHNENIISVAPEKTCTEDNSYSSCNDSIRMPMTDLRTYLSDDSIEEPFSAASDDDKEYIPEHLSKSSSNSSFEASSRKERPSVKENQQTFRAYGPSKSVILNDSSNNSSRNSSEDESGDSNCESGDSKSESGDSNSESGDSNSESGDSNCESVDSSSDSSDTSTSSFKRRRLQPVQQDDRMSLCNQSEIPFQRTQTDIGLCINNLTSDLCLSSSSSDENTQNDVDVSNTTNDKITLDYHNTNAASENQPLISSGTDNRNIISAPITVDTKSNDDDLVTVIVVLEDSSEPEIYVNSPSPLRVLALQKLNEALYEKCLPDASSNIATILGLENISIECPTTENITQSPLNDELPKKSRKRRRRGSKRSTAKIMRNLGQEYKSVFGKCSQVPARSMKRPCGDSCRLKCSERVNEQVRTDIFSSYWNTGSLSKQREFIAAHTEEIKPKYQYKRIDSNRKNKQAFYLTVNKNKLRVCKTFFKNTLGINDRPIRTVLEKKQDNGILESDKRGKHENHATKISLDLLNGVREHINSIPRIESHYLRQQTTREYIEGDKTITDLYNDYREDCIKNDKEFVKIHMYRKVFNEEFNIGFYIPKKDQCNVCTSYKNRSVQEKAQVEESYQNHLREKEKSREERRKDKQSANENRILACYDLQAVMPVPKGEASVFYYKSKLNCFNFTVCELQGDHTDCYFWTEVEGQRGANEIGSCILMYLKKKSETSSVDCLEFIFYSDNCCGQQKNQFVMAMYIYALKHFANIKSITHKYLIAGHTQNKGDSVHSTIEKKIKRMKKAGPIFVPDQYIHAIKEAKQKEKEKYQVNEMSHRDFYDIKQLKEYQLTRNTEGEHVKMSDIKIIKMEKVDSDVNGLKVFYKTSYFQEDYMEIKLKKAPRARPRLQRLYNSRLPLAENKKKDIQSLIEQRHIPLYYASSYYNYIIQQQQ